MVSHVPPVPSTAGQRQRVKHTLEALRREFDVTFITSARNLDEHPDIVDHADSVRTVGATRLPLPRQVLQRMGGEAFALRTGLKRSNYDIRQLFGAENLATVIDPSAFDLAFVHYWHAVDAVSFFQEAGTPCVLDMHDILWRARGSQLRERRFVPASWARVQERRYRVAEEHAWRAFDGIVAINDEERREAAGVVGQAVPVWYAPMGVHLESWRYGHDPSDPPRLAYYGGLNTPARESAVVQCVDEIMPAVWDRHPDCEFWVVGANPTPKIVRLGDDPRVRVTGFVDDPASTLASMWGLLCPFSGQFGFRSRLIEVMACGVPVIGTPDAVYGMGLEMNDSLLLHDSSAGLAEASLEVLADRKDALRRGRLARAQAENFGFEATYGTMAGELAAFAEVRASQA